MISLTNEKKNIILVAIALSLLLCIIPAFAIVDSITGALTSLWNTFLSAINSFSQTIISAGHSLFFLAIKFTILDFAYFWNDLLAHTFKTIWQIMRDLVNICITVLFVLTALGTIISDGFGLKRKTLLFLLVAAVLNNFSAFIALVLVDISNAITLVLYNQIDIANIIFTEHITGDGLILELTDASGSVLWNTIFTIVIFGLAIAIFIILFMFCITLLERFLYAILIVTTSPIAVIGFFLKVAKKPAPESKKKRPPPSIGLEKIILDFYTLWKEKLNSIFIIPIILFSGYFLGSALFFTMLKQADVSNKTIAGPGSFETLILVIIACTLLIIILLKTLLFATRSSELLKTSVPLNKSESLPPVLNRLELSEARRLKEGYKNNVSRIKGSPFVKGIQERIKFKNFKGVAQEKTTPIKPNEPILAKKVTERTEGESPKESKFNTETRNENKNPENNISKSVDTFEKDLEQKSKNAETKKDNKTNEGVSTEKVTEGPEEKQNINKFAETKKDNKTNEGVSTEKVTEGPEEKQNINKFAETKKDNKTNEGVATEKVTEGPEEKQNINKSNKTQKMKKRRKKNKNKK